MKNCDTDEVKECKNCGTCHYWVQTHPPKPTDKPHKIHTHGHCHLKPPYTYQTTKDIQKHAGEPAIIVTDDVQSGWPFTYKGEWCGSWKEDIIELQAAQALSQGAGNLDTLALNKKGVQQPRFAITT
jgi:hypothetical protein